MFYVWYVKSSSGLWIQIISDEDYSVAERIKIRRSEILPKGTEFAVLEVERLEDAPERTRNLPKGTQYQQVEKTKKKRRK